VTDKKVDYIKTKGFDDAHFKNMIVEYLKKFGKAKRSEIDRLVIPKLSDVLTDKQKKSKVGNLLTSLKKEGRAKALDHKTWSII
jgi:ATP-dependent DNA helicase RecG